jgi:hypothetical protein
LSVSSQTTSSENFSIMTFKILQSDILLPHFSIQEDELGKRMANFQGFQNTIQDFTFYTSSSVVYSSKIEGVEIELDSYLKHKLLGVKFLVDYTKKADDLFEDYSIARSRILNEKSLLEVHKLITKNFLRASQRGRWRVSPMFVMGGESILYVATNPKQVKGELVNIPSEKYYYNNKNEYYHNLQRIGFEYDSMDYTKALPFVNMLVACV